MDYLRFRFRPLRLAIDRLLKIADR